jgi:hypothetical protein
MELLLLKHFSSKGLEERKFKAQFVKLSFILFMLIERYENVFCRKQDKKGKPKTVVNNPAKIFSRKSLFTLNAQLS